MFNNLLSIFALQINGLWTTFDLYWHCNTKYRPFSLLRNYPKYLCLYYFASLAWSIHLLEHCACTVTNISDKVTSFWCIFHSMLWHMFQHSIHQHSTMPLNWALCLLCTVSKCCFTFGMKTNTFGNFFSLLKVCSCRQTMGMYFWQLCCIEVKKK